tara:strand:- start:989 stop:2284 length:1296 start_codon:yes stop_codon:yes gene_type:complete
MGGGLMQLVAYGAQDIYLTGNPQITFFKVVYRRHTNFSMEAIQQTFNGTFGTGSSSVTSTISRNGDLVSDLWLDIGLDRAVLAATGTYANWTNNTGHAFVKDCEIEIGGQRIDRHYAQWLDVWNELTDHDESEWIGLNKHAAKNAYLKSGSAVATAAGDEVTRVYVPLQFWFCRNPGLALPLIALQYHEVKLKLTTRAIGALVNTDGTTVLPTTPPTCELWADYIYLDTDERRRFAQVSHEYLIEQVQRETGTMTTSQKLNFNHPVKELIWTVQATTAAVEGIADSGNDATLNIPTAAGSAFKNSDYFNYSPGSSGANEIINGQSSEEGFTDLKLQLNGHDRFAKRNASYFRTCQAIQAGHKVPSKHVYCYSFALKPEEHQPSGTCNFSRIDNAKMVFTGGDTTNTTLTVWAVNYNVLRIMSGMGGLAYSN